MARRYGSRGRYRMAMDVAGEAAHLQSAIEEVEAEQEQAEAYSTYGRTGGAVAGMYAGAALGSSLFPVVGTTIGGAIGAGVGSLAGSYGGEAIAASKGRQSISTGGKFLRKEKEEAQKELDRRKEKRREGYAFSALGDIATAGIATGADVAFKEGAKKATKEGAKITGSSLWQSFKGGVKGLQEHTWTTKDIIKSKLPSELGGQKWESMISDRGIAAEKERVLAEQSAKWLGESQEILAGNIRFEDQMAARKAKTAGRYIPDITPEAGGLTSKTTSTKNLTGRIIDPPDAGTTTGIPGLGTIEEHVPSPQGPFRDPAISERHIASRQRAAAIEGYADLGDPYKGPGSILTQRKEIPGTFGTDAMQRGMLPGGTIAEALERAQREQASRALSMSGSTDSFYNRLRGRSQ